MKMFVTSPVINAKTYHTGLHWFVIWSQEFRLNLYDAKAQNDMFKLVFKPTTSAKMCIHQLFRFIYYLCNTPRGSSLRCLDEGSAMTRTSMYTPDSSRLTVSSYGRVCSPHYQNWLELGNEWVRPWSNLACIDHKRSSAAHQSGLSFSCHLEQIESSSEQETFSLPLNMGQSS